MNSRIRIKGMVTVRVFGSDGKVKRREPSLWRRLLGLDGKKIEQRHHNIITREGDALIADALLPNHTRTKVGGTGYIQVGTGWNNTGTKKARRCNKPVGIPEQMDMGYPRTKGAWGNTGDNTVVYRATYEPGDLEANGINEAILMNGNTDNAVSLAYAQITPVANVTKTDTLQIVWEITISGQ